MKALMLLILGIGLVIFFIQNSAPISLVFWGMIKTPSLPLAIWILSFAVAGIFSSLLLQLLSGKPREVASKRDYLRDSQPYSPQPRPTPFSEPKKPQTREEERNIPDTSPSGWGRGEDEDWDIEEPPQEPTSPKYPSEKPPERREEQPLQTLPRNPSPYSYVYREKETVKPPAKSAGIQSREVSKKGQVYDANYRVITPPDRQYTQSPERTLDEDEEEWV